MALLFKQKENQLNELQFKKCDTLEDLKALYSKKRKYKRDLYAIGEGLRRLLPLIHLKLDPTSICKDMDVWKIIGTCEICNVTRLYRVENFISKTPVLRCKCQRHRKYDNDPRAELLGRRYDCMIQRCYCESHKQSNDHTGVEVQFESREHFVKWGLETWPDTDFKGLKFVRIDNNGPYSPANLKLVTIGENHKNVHIVFQGKKMHWSDWPSPYCPRRTQAYASEGRSGEEIIQLAIESANNKCKNWMGLEARLKELGYIG